MSTEQRCIEIWYESVKPVPHLPLESWERCNHRHPLPADARQCAEQLGIEWRAAKAQKILLQRDK